MTSRNAPKCHQARRRLVDAVDAYKAAAAAAEQQLESYLTLSRQRSYLEIRGNSRLDQQFPNLRDRLLDEHDRRISGAKAQLENQALRTVAAAAKGLDAAALNIKSTLRGLLPESEQAIEMLDAASSLAQAYILDAAWRLESLAIAVEKLEAIDSSRRPISSSDLDSMYELVQASLLCDAPTN